MDHYCRICSDEITENEYERLNSCNLPLLMQLYLPELVGAFSKKQASLQLALFVGNRSSGLPRLFKMFFRTSTVPHVTKKGAADGNLCTEVR